MYFFQKISYLIKNWFNTHKKKYWLDTSIVWMFAWILSCRGALSDDHDDHVATDIEWSIIRRRKIARAPHLHKTIVDSMPRCGTFAFRRVQLLVFKVAGKSGDWSLTVHKNERSGLVESLMRPTKRVARLRATNNSYLYPFPLSSSFLTRSSFSFPSVGILVRLRLRCLSFLSLPFRFFHSSK